MGKINLTNVPTVMVSLVLMISVQVPGAWPIRWSISEEAQQQSNNRALSFVDGSFIIDGKVPPAFSDFEYLYLEGGSFKLAPDGKRMIADPSITLKGEVQGKRKRIYKLKKATMESDSLTFESLAIGGISFQFSGRVFKGGPTDDDFVKIEGHLLKYLNGKKVAEAQVTFVWVEPGD
jgi:hypothetical protein